MHGIHPAYILSSTSEYGLCLIQGSQLFLPVFGPKALHLKTKTSQRSGESAAVATPKIEPGESYFLSDS